MSVTPRGGQHQKRNPPPTSPGLSSTMLLILALSVTVVMITVTNPPWGIAIGVGIAMVGLLCTIVI